MAEHWVAAEHPDWINTYLELTKPQVSPQIFHQWSAIAVLGAALERRVWLTRQYKTIRVYPGQLMVVLTGASALYKKTTAADMATDFLTTLPSWAVNVMPKKTSPQRLLKILERLDSQYVPLGYPDELGPPLAGRRVNSTGFINAGELSVFFSTDNFNEALASTINDLNDAKQGKQKVEFMSWQAELWNPMIGMLGCITPAGIAKELPKAARTVGFFGRVLWVYTDEPPKSNPLTRPIPNEGTLREVLIRGINAAATVYGSYQFSPAGMAWFEHWYEESYMKKIRGEESAGVIDSTGYWGRKDSHLLRVAIVCSFSRSWGRDRLLKRVDLERASNLLTELEKGFPGAFAEIGVGSQYTEENQRILTHVSKRAAKYRQGWVPYDDVARYTNTFGMRKFQRDDALGRLVDGGELEQRWGERGVRQYRRRWTSGGLMRQATEEREPDPPLNGTRH